MPRGLKMYIINKCPCCGSKKYKLYDAVVSPFIVEYALTTKPTLCHLARCYSCQHIFFIERFTDEETQTLYSNYRGQRYFNIRHKHEFYYSQRINDTVDGDPRIRKAATEFFLEEAKLPFDKIVSILDYGGDRGQYFPDRFNRAKKYLYDISDNTAVSHVQKVKAHELFQKKFNMLILCNILEHLSSPQVFIQSIKPLLANSGYVYIEVPYEPFSIWQWGSGRVRRLYLKSLLKIRPLFVMIDFFSLVGRLQFHFVPPFFGFIKLHEHINFFTLKSLELLLESCGFKIIKINISNIENPSSRRNKVIQCLSYI